MYGLCEAVVEVMLIHQHFVVKNFPNVMFCIGIVLDTQFQYMVVVLLMSSYLNSECLQKTSSHT